MKVSRGGGGGSLVLPNARNQDALIPYSRSAPSEGALLWRDKKQAEP